MTGMKHGAGIDMNLDYKDSLRDLGLTEEQIESILDLNSEYLSEALAEGDIDYLEWHLQDERFIH